MNKDFGLGFTDYFQQDTETIKSNYLRAISQQVKQLAVASGIDKLVEVDHSTKKIVLLDENLPQDILYPYLCYGAGLELETPYTLLDHNLNPIFNCLVVPTDREDMIGYNLKVTPTKIAEIIHVEFDTQGGQSGAR